MNDPAGAERSFNKALAIYRQEGLRLQEADAVMDYARTILALPRDRRPEMDFIKGLALRARAIYRQLRIERKAEAADRLVSTASR